MHLTLRRRPRGTDYAAAPWFLAVAFRTLPAISVTLFLVLAPGSCPLNRRMWVRRLGDVLRNTHTEFVVV